LLLDHVGVAFIERRLSLSFDLVYDILRCQEQKLLAKNIAFQIR
jgi:hypothetical protein